MNRPADSFLLLPSLPFAGVMTSPENMELELALESGADTVKDSRYAVRVPSVHWTWRSYGGPWRASCSIVHTFLFGLGHYLLLPRLRRYEHLGL